MKLVLIFLIFAGGIFGGEDDPSITIRLNRSGWDFLKETMLNLMEVYIPKMPIPDWEMDDDFYSLSTWNTKITRIILPNLFYNLTNQGIDIQMNDLYLSAFTEFRAVYDFIFSISSRGTAVVGAPMSATGSAKISVEGGRPQIEYRDCSVWVHDVTVDADCSLCWIFDFFIGSIQHAVRDLLIDKACDIMNSAIAKINQQLKEIPLEFELGSNFSINYKVLDMTYNPDFTETKIRGAVLYEKKSCEIEPAKISDTNLTSDSMGNVWVADQIVNCILSSAHHGGIIHFTMTKDIPEAAQYLRTTCPFKRNAVCIGTFWPKLSELYPKQYMDVHMYTKETPVMTIVPGFAIVKGVILLDFYVNPMNQTKNVLVTMEVTSESSVVIQVNGTILNGYLKDTKAEIRQVSSSVGMIEPSSVDSFRKLFVAVEEIILNALMKQGIPIPIFKEAAMALAPNSTIDMIQDFIRVNANFEHRQNSTFVMTSE